MAIALTSRSDAAIRRAVLLVAWAGAAVFALLLALAWLKPAAIEFWAGQAIATEVRQRIDAPGHGLSIAAARLALEHSKEIAHQAANAGSLAHARALTDATYAKVTLALVREVRIFSAANAFVFALLGLIAALWTRSGRQLLAPALILLGAALLVGGVYLFQQNWLQTILLGDYVGLWYFSYLLVASLFLADVVFNRGRFSVETVNIVVSTVGGIFSAASC